MKSMERIERRQLLKTTGAGVALGVGTASARETVETQQSTTTTFTATATDGFLAIDADSADASGDGTRLPLAGSDVDGQFVIEGEINPDGTWESTSTTLPSFSETRDSGNFIVGDITVSVNYFLDGSMTGTIDRAGNAMTGTMPLRIDLEVSDFPGGPAGDTIPADANSLTTGSSGSMTGSASGLNTDSGSATLVDNQFTMPGTGTDLVDEVFGLPSQSSGRNWMELQFDMSFSEVIGTFTGTVTENRDALSGVTITVNDGGTTVTTATTDSNGEYSVEVPPGEYDLVADDPEYEQVTKTRTVNQDQTVTVDFQLTKDTADPGSVTGVVLSKLTGSLIEGQTVTLVDNGTTVDSATTDVGGLYALNAAPGDYTIVVEREGYETFNKPVTIQEGTTTNLDIELVKLPQFAQKPIADPNGDGLYEDVRGDGSVDILDVQELFNELDSGNPQLQNHSEKFNFQGNNPDQVTILDVQALFNQLPE